MDYSTSEGAIRAQDEREDVVKIRAQLENFSRNPFRDILAATLNAAPTPAEIRVFAARWPDRWANLVTMFARLAGYSEKSEVITNNYVLIANLSDSELLKRLHNLESILRSLPQPIDITNDSKTNV